MTQLNTDMILQLNELEQGKHHYSFNLDDAYFKAIEKSEVIGGNVAVEADLALRESDYSLHIKATGEVQLICDRCLAPMTYAIDVEDDIQSGEEDDLSGSGPNQPCGNDTLDLGWIAYETITINLPLVHSHPDGECTPDMQQLLQAFGVPASNA